MKKIIDKVLSLKFNKKVLMWLLLVLMVLAYIPVFRLALYSAPFYDDYGYNQNVKSFYQAYGLKGIWEGMKYTVNGMWYAWQGTYASIAFMSLTPLFLGEQYYFLGVYAVIIGITLGAFVFTFTGTKNVLKADNYEAVSVSVIVTLFLLEFIYSSYAGIFWYNSAVHYTFMHGIMLLMLAAAIKVLYTKKIAGSIVLMAVAAGLAYLSAGANFVTCLQGLLFLLVVMALGFIFKNKKTFFLVPVTLIYAIGLRRNVIAPGNRVRGAHFEGQGPIEAILNSFKEAFLRIPELTSIGSIAVLLVLVPSIVFIVRRINFKFRFPGLVTVFSFCLYATGFTSSFYSMGGAPIARTMVAVKFTYQILLCINLIYWLGWSNRRFEKVFEKSNHHLIYYFALALVLVLSFVFSKDQAGGYLSYGSYIFTHSCSAQNFHQEYINRIDKIKNSSESVVEVTPYAFRPWLLVASTELSEDPNAEQNSFMARYYGKEAIILVREE